MTKNPTISIDAFDKVAKNICREDLVLVRTHHCRAKGLSEDWTV